MMLLYGDESADQGLTEQEQEAMMAEWFQYTDELQAAGVMVGGEALMPTPTTTTLRLDGERRIVTDGPFAETKEALGGYYLLQVDSLEQALDWAAKCPGARTGPIELRPVMEFDMPEAPSA
jgi:hypothetical protein